MADVNANIHIGIDATQALGQLRALQNQISQFNRSVVAGNAAAAATQASMASSLASMVGATGQFNTSIRTMETGVSSLGTAFDKGTLSGRQFFRYAASQMPGLTRAFRGLGVEQARMAELATDRVKRLQTQYVDLGKDVRGMQKVMAIQPKNLATGYATDLAIAQQRQQLFNRALQMGSTGLVNWGKNTQWAGRQLMVGFTVPLTIAAGAAAKFFMELDKASMQFRRVYGDMNTSTEETYRNLEAIKSLGVEYTKYGLAVSDVIDIGARAAATGAQNEDLMAATEQTLRLATLGQMEYGRALDATISLQTAFGISAEELGNKINFLNAVENQTVLTMEDMALAVPRVAPVIKGLGGDVEDLAVFMTALREGGVTAEQGANALKSGLASLINPTNRAQESLNALGINIKEIVQTNRGDLMGTVKAFGDALNSLDEFERQQALEQVFGKYQYARLGALFKNISNDASQSAQAMELAGASVEELRGMAEKELSIVAETVTNQFLGAVERLKVAIAPIGEIFLKAVTPVINAVSAIADAFNGLPDGVKTAIGAVVGIVGGLAPVFLMGIGLIGNAIGNGIKFILTLRNGVKSLAATLTGSASNFKYQSGAALDSAAAMASLEGRVSSLTGDLLMQEGAVAALTAAYGRLAGAASAAAASMPRGFAMPGVAGGGRPGGLIPPIRMATGGLVPGRGSGDTVPALLTPGESVITKEATSKYAPILAAMNAGTLPGFATGVIGYGNEAAWLSATENASKRYAGAPTATQLGASFAAMFSRAFSKTAAQELAVASKVFQSSGRAFSIFADNFANEVNEVKRITGNAIVTEKELVEARSRAAATTARQIQDIERQTGRPMMTGPSRQMAFSYMGLPGYDAPITTLSRVGSGHSDPIGRGNIVSGVRAIRNAPGGATPQERMSLSYRSLGRGLTEWLRETTGIQRGQMGHIAPSRIMTAEEATPLLGGRLPSAPAARANIEAVRSAVSSGEPYAQLGTRVAGEIVPGMQAAGRAGGTAFGASLVTSSAAASRPMPQAVLSATGHASPAAVFGTAGTQDGTLYGQRYSNAALAQMARLVEQRKQMFGNEFDDGRPMGPVSGINDRPVPSDNLSRRQMAAGRAKVARRRFAGAIGGLSAVILSGPVADIQNFAQGEAKKFANQMKSATNGMKKGFAKISEAARSAGNRLLDATPSAFKGAPMPADIANKARVLGNQAFGGALVGGINAIENSAKQIKRFGTLMSDMSQAGRYGDIKSATKMLANAIGGTAAIKPIVDSSKNLGNSVRNTWRTLRSATRDIATTFNALGTVDAARMARNIVGLDKLGQSIRTTTSGVMGSVKSFGSTVGSAFRDISTTFRQGGFRAAAAMTSQITGITGAVNGIKTGFTNIVRDVRDISMGTKELGKEMVRNAGRSFSETFRNVGRSISDASMRSFDRALGGWQGMKRSFAGIGSAFQTAGAEGARAVSASLKSAAASISAGVTGMFRSGGIDPTTGQRMPSRFEQRFGRSAMGIGMMGSMASMIPFMAQDQEGKFMGMNANMLGMGMMGGFGMLSMIGTVPGPLLAVAAAASAAAGGLYLWRNSVDTAAREAADFGANIGGAANALNNMAAMLGKATPAQRQVQMELGFTEAQQEEAFGEFQGMMNTEEGQKFIEDLKAATAPERFAMLSQYIKAAVASGMMDAENAQLFAKTIASAIEDSVLGTSVISELRKGITEGSQGLLEMARSREASVSRTSATQAATSQEVISYQDSSAVVGSSIQVIQDFANAAALAREEYMNGIISYQEYIVVLNEARDAQANYAENLYRAVDKTSDIGATAQAIESQLKSLGLTAEEISRLEEAGQIEGNLRADIAGALIGIGAIKGFFDKGTQGDYEERKEIETKRMALATAAVAEGMEAGIVAGIQQYMAQNPESRAVEAFTRLEGQPVSQRYQAAGMVQSAEVMGVPGLSEADTQRYINIGINFMEQGGTIQQYMNFVNNIPEERRVQIITEFSGMTPQQQQMFIANYEKMSSLVGADVTNKIREENARRAEEDAAGLPRRTKDSTIKTRTATRESMLNERSLRAIERAKESGVFENLESTIDIIMNEDPPDLESRLPDLEEKIIAINENIPPEMQKTLGIDITNIDDVDKYGPMAVELGQLVAVIDGIEDQQVKDLAINMMYKQNGKLKDVMSFAKDVNQLKKDLAKFSSIDVADTKARKEMAVEIVTTMTGPQGMLLDGDISASDVDAALQHVLELTGLTEAAFFRLPDDVITKVLKYGVDSTQFSAAAARLEAAANAAAKAGVDDPETARAIERWRTAAAELRAAAQSADVGATTTTAGGYASGGRSPSGSGGGSSGGGGAGEEDPLKAMMKDLKTQNKLIGDFAKEEGKVVKGFSTALRRAGMPEYLIAEIVAKGKDGIEIAKKLLKDKQKKLKELMDLSLQVTRMTMIEQNRAAANNFRTQANAQNALFGAGIDPSTAIDIASDPQQAAAIADSYKRVQDAQRKLDSAKGKGAKEKAAKELRSAKKEWDQLTNSIKEATRAQIQFNINSGVKAQTKAEKKALGIQGGALTRLMTQGFSFEQAQGFAGDEMVAGAIVAAGRAADAAAQRAAAAAQKVKDLEARQKKLKEENKQGTKAWKNLVAALREARRASTEAAEQADKTSEKYKALLADLEALTEAQKKNLVTNTIAEYKGLNGELQMQIGIIEKLREQGMSYAQAIDIASDPQKVLAFAAALEQPGDAFKNLVAEAMALEAITAKLGLELKMLEFGDAQKKNQFRGAVTGLTAGNPFGDMVTDYLMNLNTAELQEFFNQTPEWRQEFVDAFLESIPLAEKIKYLFDQISAQQKYQSTLNKDATNVAKGDIEALDEKLKAQRKLLKAEQDKLKVAQKSIEVIQEENDDLNRGLDLLSRQEEKINEAFDKRIEALDKVEQANARIAQQQQNQLNLSQALSSGDIYAATQAAQQIKQDNATAAIENTREALELAREEQLKNLAVEVNGELLTREEIEKRIESNNDRIYQIQEDQVEVIEAAIDVIQDEIDKVEDLKDAWQEYFDFLEENSKITIEIDGKKIDFTFKELQDIGQRFQEIMSLPGMTAEQAFNQVIADLEKAGKALTEDEIAALREYFGVPAIPVAAPEDSTGDSGEVDPNAENGDTGTDGGDTGTEEAPVGGDITADVNAARDAAILSLPEIQKILDVAKAIWPEIAKWEDNILAFAGAVKDTVNPSVASTRNMIAKIGQHLVETVNPQLTPIRNKWDRIKNYAGTTLEKMQEMAKLLPDLGKSFEDNLVKSFNNVIQKIVQAIGKVKELISELNAIPKKIQVNINIHTTHTSSGGSGQNSGGNQSGSEQTGGNQSGSASPMTYDQARATVAAQTNLSGRELTLATREYLQSQRMFSGGLIVGAGSRDTIPIMSSPGEFVIKSSMVDKYGMSMLNDINQGSYEPSFRTPSVVTYAKINKPIQANSNSTMYNNNYSINVTANTNANADEIANATIMKIRQMNSMQIRGARG